MKDIFCFDRERLTQPDPSSLDRDRRRCREGHGTEEVNEDHPDAGPCRARKIRQKIDGLTFIFDGTEFRKYTYALNGDDYRDRKKRQSAEKCIHHVVRGRKVSSEFHLKDSHSRRRRLVGSCFFRIICMKFHSGKSSGMDIDRKD